MNGRINSHTAAHFCPKAIALKKVELEIDFEVSFNFKTRVSNKDAEGNTVFITLGIDVDVFLLLIDEVPCLLPRRQARLKHGFNHFIVLMLCKIIVKLTEIILVGRIDNEGVKLTFVINKLLEIFFILSYFIKNMREII